jgi:hypothetical protein
MARTKKKSKSRARQAKRAGVGAHELRWMPEVSESGELFLRRREVTPSGEPGEMN